jgi:membrane protein implicated in regulation of membrane protease activity
MENKNVVTIQGVTFPTLLTLIFITLKLIGIITWPWIWVLAPLWIGFVLFMGFLLISILLLKLFTSAKKTHTDTFEEKFDKWN